MPIPSELQTLVNRLNQELDEIEQDSTIALHLVRQRLSLFPTNEILIQFFGALNNILLFAEINRGRIQNIVDRISSDDVSTEVVQDAGEDLGLILGRVLEVKMNANQLRNRLEN